MNKTRTEHWSYLWLFIGFVFLVFSNGIHYVIPLATWLAPLFLLRFLRTQPKLKGLLLIAPLYFAGWVIMLFGILPDLGIIGNGFGLFYGIVLFLPFLADRLITPRIEGFLATLVFPFAWVTVEFVLASWDLTGSWFALAYTQRDQLPLIQLVSITGIWGVSFLITWFASVVNWAWEQEFAYQKTWRGGTLYLAVFMVIYLFGGAYLTFLPAASDTVRAAAITRSFDMDIEAKKCKGDVPCLQTLFNSSLDEFLQASKLAANAGSKIIVWQENGLATYQVDEASFVEQGREFAVQEKVYLVMGMYMLSEDRSVDENKVILIDPLGQVSEYLKNRMVAGDTHILGDGKVLIQDSDYGKLASIICQDTHSPDFVRQAGKANVDIILIPNHNWAAITPYAAKMASFRAIENGFSMIRADYHGLSTAVDYHGNLLSQMNDFTTKERIMLADIPTHGIQTVYVQIGDSFAWLNGLGFLAMIALSFGNFTKKQV